MNNTVRFWQKVMLCLSMLNALMAWWSNSVLSCVLAFICVALAVFILLTPTPEERVQAKIKLLQQKGVYPQGQATDEDVRRVLQAGHKVLAVKLYKELHNVSLKQAVAAMKQIS